MHDPCCTLKWELQSSRWRRFTSITLSTHKTRVELLQISVFTRRRDCHVIYGKIQIFCVYITLLRKSEDQFSWNRDDVAANICRGKSIEENDLATRLTTADPRVEYFTCAINHRVIVTRVLRLQDLMGLRTIFGSKTRPHCAVSRGWAKKGRDLVGVAKALSSVRWTFPRRKDQLFWCHRCNINFVLFAVRPVLVRYTRRLPYSNKILGRTRNQQTFLLGRAISITRTSSVAARNFALRNT